MLRYMYWGQPHQKGSQYLVGLVLALIMPHFSVCAEMTCFSCIQQNILHQLTNNEKDKTPLLNVTLKSLCPYRVNSWLSDYCKYLHDQIEQSFGLAFLGKLGKTSQVLLSSVLHKNALYLLHRQWSSGKWQASSHFWSSRPVQDSKWLHMPHIWSVAVSDHIALGKLQNVHSRIHILNWWLKNHFKVHIGWSSQPNQHICIWHQT